MVKSNLKDFRPLAGKLQEWTFQDRVGVPTGNYVIPSFLHLSYYEINYLTHSCPQMSFHVHLKCNGSMDTIVHECLQESCRDMFRVPIGLFENYSASRPKTLTQFKHKSKTSLREAYDFVS